MEAPEYIYLLFLFRMISSTLIVLLHVEHLVFASVAAGDVILCTLVGYEISALALLDGDIELGRMASWKGEGDHQVRVR